MQRLRVKFLIGSLLLLTFSGCSVRDKLLQSGVTSSDLSTPTVEQLQRKQRSEQQLQAGGVPINTDLGVVPAEIDVRLRDEAEVATRALCLIVVATKADGIPDQLIDTMIKRYELAEHFTPLEQAFIAAAEPSPEQIVSAQWRYESARTLLWALGVVDTLAPPDQGTDVPAMVRVMTSMTSESFRAAASLRPTTDILDAADVSYRYHRATHAAPGKVIDSVIYEREYALNWLISQRVGWDDIEAEITE